MDHAEVDAVRACRELADLCRDSIDAKKNRKVVFQSRGHESVLNAMRRHKASWCVQAEGLRALANISSDSPRAKAAIASLDGIETILGTMIRFPDVPEVQRNGSFLLKNLCKSKEPATHVVDHPDGVQFVVGAIKDYSSKQNGDAEIVGYMCCALANIASHTDFNEQIIIAGGLVALAEAKAKHQDNDDVQKASRVAMKLLVKE